VARASLNRIACRRAGLRPTSSRGAVFNSALRERRHTATNKPVRLPPITERSWTEEVVRTLAAAGLPWKVGSCWCEKAACAAEVIHRGTGKTRLIMLPLDTFSTAALRRFELVRALQAKSSTPAECSSSPLR